MFFSRYRRRIRTHTLVADSNFVEASATYVVTGRSAGSHTFTAKYRVNGGGNAQFSNRGLIVIPQ